MLSKLKLLTAIAGLAIALSGCSSVVSEKTPVTAELPERVRLSGYQAGLKANDIANLKTEFKAIGTVVEIAPERHFTAADAVTQKQQGGAVYYTPLRVNLDKATAGLPGEVWISVLSDYDPKTDISGVKVGDQLLMTLDGPFTRSDGLTTYSFWYLGLVDSANGTIQSLNALDESPIDLAYLLSAFKL